MSPRHRRETEAPGGWSEGWVSPRLSDAQEPHCPLSPFPSLTERKGLQASFHGLVSATGRG